MRRGAPVRARRRCRRWRPTPARCRQTRTRPLNHSITGSSACFFDAIDLVQHEHDRLSRAAAAGRAGTRCRARPPRRRRRPARRRRPRARAPTAASTIRTFMRCMGRWTPGVSRNRICPSGRFFAPRMRVRVVCGLSETMASLRADEPVEQRRLARVGPPEQRRRSRIAWSTPPPVRGQTAARGP